MTHFELFDLDVSFHVDKSDLRKRFIKMSRETHPDLSGSDSLAQSTAVNNAYKVLIDDFMRIRYVLNLAGYGIEQDDTVPMDFLMEMMEWNERIESAATKEADQPKLIEDFEALKKGLDSKLHAKTEEYDRTRNESLLTTIKEICLKQKYLLRMQESIDKFAPR